MSPRRTSVAPAALLSAVVLAVLAGLLAPLAPASAATSPAVTPAVAPAVTPAATPGRDDADGADALHLGDDAVHARTSGTARAAIAWRGSRLYVRETLPARWDWSLRTAIATWNASGSRITLVRTTSRRVAQVTVSYGDTGGAAGLATVGRTRGAFVELSSAYRVADATSAHTRVEVMNVLAHELGHVLGLDHTTTACSLMAPVLDVAGCGVVAAEHPGAYGCRTIDAPLASRLVRLYGGSPRVAPRGWCLIDPLPGSLGGVDISVRAGGLAVTWRPPTSVPAGSLVELRLWTGDCAQQPVDVVREFAPVSAGAWVEPSGLDSDCVTVGLVNRYGLARTLTGGIVSAGAVAVAPVAPAAP
ncbi:matrixin family metalloprotease [Nocardioides aurantiacus]|uniref:Matrixin n=1 Tax=Nocardioides aurantiacus TaxID=86796 RepID=A0A3N2CXF0_9ACTN|nr:M57 family metalloprotease [Nocardioides aurantiacus]ROR92205.1 matrixin [Nocardioides aurantiacus]